MNQRRCLSALLVAVAACTPSRTPQTSQGGRLADAREAAQRTYVTPGKLDDYYLFYSGGHSGQVYVAGIP